MTLNALISFSVNGIPNGMLTCCLPLPEGVTAEMFKRIFYDAQSPTLEQTLGRLYNGLGFARVDRLQAAVELNALVKAHQERNLPGAPDLLALQAAASGGHDWGLGQVADTSAAGPAVMDPARTTQLVLMLDVTGPLVVRDSKGNLVKVIIPGITTDAPTIG